jgi:hypothetical protein
MQTSVVQEGRETVIRIPNALLGSAEVLSFMAFLEKTAPPKATQQTTKIRDQFELLFQTWKLETGLLSSGTAIVNHAAYQKIISLGEAVLPFLLMKLQQDPQHLFYALFQITGENPVPFAHAGNLEKMTADWLSWGKTKGYLN